MMSTTAMAGNTNTNKTAPTYIVGSSGLPVTPA
jgi:hypothetical protein